LTDTFTPSVDDLEFLPDSVSPTNDIFFAQFGEAKHRRLITAYTTTNTGRYHVNFHQGSRVYVNNFKKIQGIDYIVSPRRNRIQFLAGKVTGHQTQGKPKDASRK
jgi:hypothetical protein